jgi:hypothetical protein
MVMAAFLTNLKASISLPFDHLLMVNSLLQTTPKVANTQMVEVRTMQEGIPVAVVHMAATKDNPTEAAMGKSRAVMTEAHMTRVNTDEASAVKTRTTRYTSRRIIPILLATPRRAMALAVMITTDMVAGGMGVTE